MGASQWSSECPAWLPAHPTPTHSDQASQLVWPQDSHGRVSDVWFHKAIYFWCSNTGRAKGGASEEHTQQRKPWAFILSQALYILTFLQRPGILPLLCVHPHLWSQVFTSFVIQKVCSSQLLLCLSIHPPGRCHPSSCPLLSQGLAVHSPLSGTHSQSSTCISTCISISSLQPSYLEQTQSSTT